MLISNWRKTLRLNRLIDTALSDIPTDNALLETKSCNQTQALQHDSTGSHIARPPPAFSKPQLSITERLYYYIFRKAIAQSAELPNGYETRTYITSYLRSAHEEEEFNRQFNKRFFKHYKSLN